MARKRRSPEEIVAKLREVEALRLKGKTCGEAVRSIGVSEATYRRWRAEFGGLIRTLGPNHASVEKPRVTQSWEGRRQIEAERSAPGLSTQATAVTRHKVAQVLQSTAVVKT